MDSIDWNLLFFTIKCRQLEGIVSLHFVTMQEPLQMVSNFGCLPGFTLSASHFNTRSLTWKESILGLSIKGLLDQSLILLHYWHA